MTEEAPGGQGFDDVAGLFDSTVGDHRDVSGASDRVDDGCDLWNAHTGHDARRADRSRTDAHLHGVHASL